MTLNIKVWLNVDSILSMPQEILVVDNYSLHLAFYDYEFRKL